MRKVISGGRNCRIKSTEEKTKYLERISREAWRRQPARTESLGPGYLRME